MKVQKFLDFLASLPTEFPFECEVRLREGETTTARSTSIHQFWEHIEYYQKESIYQDFVGIQKKNSANIVAPGSAAVEPGSYTLVSRTHYLNDIELDNCISEGVQRLNEYRSLEPSNDAIQRVDQELLLRDCHFSLSLNGNAITLDQLEKLWKLVAQHNLKDDTMHMFENLSNYDLMEALNRIIMAQNIQNIAQCDINEELVLKLHSKLMHGLLHDESMCLPGEYRKFRAWPESISFLPGDPDEIEENMEDFYYVKRDNDETLFDYLARKNTKLLWAWPFLDGNRSMGLIIMQVLLLQQGYPVFALHPSLIKVFNNAANLGVKGKKDCSWSHRVSGEKLLSRMLAEATFSSLQAYENAIGKQLLPCLSDIIGGGGDTFSESS